MNDRRETIGIIVAHGELAHGLVDAVRQIAGEAADALVPLSNRGLSPEAIAAKITEFAQGRRAILFTDLQSGSCAFVARRLCHQGSGLVVVSGVNLPMLLDFVMHRDMAVAELVSRVLDRGRVAIGATQPPNGAGGVAAPAG